VRASLALLLCAACGSTQPAPSPVVANTPPPAPASVATCTDVGVILRGEVESDDEDAGPAREKVVATACEQDRWSQPIIDCVASTATPTTCLDKLDDKQRASLDDALEQWHDTFVAHADADADAAPTLTCDDALADVTAIAPPIGPDAPERDWHIKQRKAFLHDECEHGWDDVLLACLVVSARIGDTAAASACLANGIDASERDEISKQLTELDRLAAKIAAAKKKPATITCAKVVAVHYGDAAWKQKLDGYKPAERKKMIAASRDRMTKACTADAWDDTLRACIVLRGGETCFASTGMRLRWGYPAAGVVTVTGIPDCDAYAKAIQSLTACSKVPQTSRDHMVRSLEQLLAQIAAAPADKRPAMGSSCKAALDAVEQLVTSVGC
jgi:hypothetical protein